MDLTVKDATGLKDFYQEVVGWTVGEVDMGGYSDFTMESSPGQAVAGICHARGTNADLPPVWLIYITVENLERSAARVVELGGKLRRLPTPAGPMGRFCALYERTKA